MSRNKTIFDARNMLKTFHFVSLLFSICKFGREVTKKNRKKVCQIREWCVKFENKVCNL